jgi:hypothetical protein
MAEFKKYYLVPVDDISLTKNDLPRNDSNEVGKSPLDFMKKVPVGKKMKVEKMLQDLSNAGVLVTSTNELMIGDKKILDSNFNDILSYMTKDYPSKAIAPVGVDDLISYLSKEYPSSRILNPVLRKELTILSKKGTRWL